MVSAPRNGQHLQQAQDAGANVEDVFHDLSSHFLGSVSRNSYPLTRAATTLPVSDKKRVFRGELVTVDAVRHGLAICARKAPSFWQRYASKNVRKAHSLPGALYNGFGLAPSMIRYLNQAMTNAFDFNESRHAAVSLLFFARSPSTVLGAVPLIIVNAVNRVKLGWLRTHILHKTGERGPFRANCDSAPSIVAPTFKIGVVTSGAHTRPSCIKGVSGLFRQGIASCGSSVECNTAL